MRKFLSLVLLTAFLLVNGSALAQPVDQTGANSAVDQRSQDRIVKQVRHELLMIPQLTIFDNLAYKVDGDTVTLMGQVRNAFIKDEAAAAIKHIEGVEKINNQIEVLPASFNDDRIRRQVARAVFNDPRLFEYAIQPVAPIHIIVKNGHVNLEGVVRNQVDKDSAFIRANSVPGVFSVENNLQVENLRAAK